MACLPIGLVSQPVILATEAREDTCQSSLRLLHERGHGVLLTNLVNHTLAVRRRGEVTAIT